ncbi:response regulator [Alkalilimnicola ehrlichii MLHE-1]|uniref:Response regulator receiver protein n=1 Tax=Alkalilimnicola ehrlichii (strain ATCC BAA-1101 / DSM 17681 / MLHE-1) TaxID=187272 RepID=Q0A6P2_ALKEH|nr:response regulator [Alkalilimnicola ehrlichii]ABI57495.1 response regulator receiver protein [Alkalilimnicola ehrlichii MLHE-1]
MIQPNVLLVDDDALVHEELTEALEDAGYNVWHANNGQGAIQTLCEDLSIRIVILDLRMPIQDGFFVLNTLRRDFGDYHGIIIITGHGTKEAALEGIRKGVTDFLEKPVSPDDVIAAVEAIQAADALKSL